MTKKEIISLGKIVDMYLPDEHKHYEESDKPKEHIYLDLITLRHIALRELTRKYK